MYPRTAEPTIKASRGSEELCLLETSELGVGRLINRGGPEPIVLFSRTFRMHIATIKEWNRV
jgi:hypothetical protein